MSLFQQIRKALGMLIPYKNIEMVEGVRSPLSPEMIKALDDWYLMYLDQAPWLALDSSIKSFGIPAFVASEIAREVTLELQWNITGTEVDSNGDMIDTPRSSYLRDEVKKLMSVLRTKTELGLAAGGVIIKPYVRRGHIFFDTCPDWEIYPLAFGEDNDLTDVIFPDTFTTGQHTYTRLERHTLTYDSNGEPQIRITQRAFKSAQNAFLGTEVSLNDVPKWAGITPEAIITGFDGMLFGWFKAAAANNVDPNSPMGASVYAKATKVIEECDRQYSRTLWEYKGGEMAIDVDPTVLKPRSDGKGGVDMPQLDRRLFRAVDATMASGEERYSVFAPELRDVSYRAGLSTLLQRVEDLCGLSRGTMTQLEHTTDSKTATELRIMKQRSYSTVADNQAALQRCLEDVIRVMDFYATEYRLAPEGQYQASFEWDDSIVTDTETQLNERLTLLNAGCESKAGMRMWYFGETEAQAKAAIEKANQEEADRMTALSGGVGPMLPRTSSVQQSAAQGKEPPGEEEDEAPKEE